MTWWEHLRLEVEAMFAPFTRHGIHEAAQVLADRIEWSKEEDRKRGYAKYLRKRADPILWAEHIAHHVAYQNRRRATDPEWRERERRQRRESAARCKARKVCMASGRFFVTPHAIKRYRERVRKCSYDEALTDLIHASEGAHYVRPAQGDVELWRSIGHPRLRLFVGPGEGSLPALLTVLGEHDDGTSAKSTD